MCHTIGDGDTYYTILNMLSETGLGVHSLTPDRVQLEEILLNINALSPDFRMSSMQALSSIVKTILMLPAIFSKKTVPMSIEVMDPEWIENEKERSVSAGAIVSTNDIMTSYLMRTNSSGVGIMAVNLRTRIPQIRAELAGNYVGFLTLQPSDYATPAGVRTALQGALLSLQNQFTPKQFINLNDVVLITNWTFFFQDMSMPGLSLIHQNILDLRCFSRFKIFNLHYVVLMRPRAGSVAIATPSAG